MARVAGSYESVVRGVSQQVPQDRRPGQHYEQINMISDPVRGLSRRHGSVNLDEKRLGTFDPVVYQQMLADTQGHKVFQFQCNGEEYDLIHRTRAAVSGNDSDFAWCFKRPGDGFIPVVTDSTPFVEALIDGGVSAAVNVGKYVFLAGTNTRPAWDGLDVFARERNHLVAWVRAGAYSRNFTVKLIRQSGTVNTITYKTPASSYPGVLDTSDIAATDTEYSKKVNDRTNAYNTAVTQWIGTAAAAIVPSAIATALAANVVTAMAGSGLTTQVVDSTICFTTTGMADPVVEITCEDAGDGTLFRGVGAEVTAAELVSVVHWAGKVIKVRPKKNDGSDVYYLKAIPKNTGSTGWTEVTWRECAGYEVLPKDLYAICTVVDGVFYIARDAASLTAMAGGTHPVPVVNGVGDRTSSPIPDFFGRRIDFMAMFQDRLVIGSGAVLYFSRTGDYQNFWRQSVLTVDDADPIEMFALGAEDDTIKAGTTYDRNLLIFGKRKQYVISGRQPMTPRNASIVVQSSHEDAVDALPIASGNFVFYNKYRNGISSAHQVQIGQLADTPESYEISKQLDQYLRGRPSELCAVTSPNVIFMRTETERRKIYTYTYLDSAAGSERLFDSWSTWTWNDGVGYLVGISTESGDLLAYYLRTGRSEGETVDSVFLACDKFVLDTDRSALPYLDSMRAEARLFSPFSSLSLDTVGMENAAVAFDVSVPEFMLGVPLPRYDEFTESYPDNAEAKWAGWQYPAMTEPTNPYILDSNGKAIVTGRLTITKVAVSIADSGGLTVTYRTNNGDYVSTDFTGRLIGRSTNQIGRQPIVTTSVTAAFGREVRDFKYQLWAREWLPLTVTAIEWTGQFFSNTRRV